MLSTSWQTIRKVPKRMRSFVGWVDDPYVGEKISTPFRRSIASGALSLILIPLHKLISVVKDFSFDQIFGALSYAADFITGTLWGYSGSGYNYKRLFWNALKSGLRAAGAGLVWAVVFLLRVCLDILQAIGSAIRRRF